MHCKCSSKINAVSINELMATTTFVKQGNTLLGKQCSRNNLH